MTEKATYEIVMRGVFGSKPFSQVNTEANALKVFNRMKDNGLVLPGFELELNKCEYNPDLTTTLFSYYNPIPADS